MIEKEFVLFNFVFLNQYKSVLNWEINYRDSNSVY
jgi:hypothetical protein